MSRITFIAFFACALAVWGSASWSTRQHVARAEFIASTFTPDTASALPTGSYSDIHGHDGFWRLAKTRDGVWWFLSPENKIEFLNGVTTVQPTLRGRDPRGPDYTSRDWDGRDDASSLNRWAQMTLDRVRSIGFKSLGAWSNPAFHRSQIPMTQDLNVWHWVPYDARLFSPDWKRDAEAAIRDQTGSLRDDRNLIGYYIDNELNWDDEAVGARVYFDQLPAEDPNRREVVQVIHETWPTVNDFNRDWNTTFGSWSEIDHHPKLPMGAKNGYDALETRWLAHFAQAYFRVTTDLIRKYDPNHLILGCRYRGWAPPEVPRGARGLTDAQSLNYYASDALLDADTFRTIYQESAQPLIISEYSFHALDGRSGNRNLSHFPAEVANQEARALGYRDMTSRLARVPYVVGADWFQWMDEPASGRQGDGEDANMGIVDVKDLPYNPLAQAVRQTAPLLNPFHSASMSTHDETVWRQPPTGARPTQALASTASEMLPK